jgi:hypothetical protein
MMLPSCPPAYSGNAIIFELGCPDILVGLIVTKEVRFLARGTDKDIGNTYIIIFFRRVDMFFLQPFTSLEVRAEWNTEILALAYWRGNGPGHMQDIRRPSSLGRTGSLKQAWMNFLCVLYFFLPDLFDIYDNCNSM